MARAPDPGGIVTKRRGRPASGLELLPAARSPKAGGLAALLDPGAAALGARNRLSNFTFFLLAAAGGSAASVVAVLLAGWALISLALRRFRWRIERSDRPVVVSTLLFFAVIAGSTLAHAAGTDTLAAAMRSVGERLLFVLPLFLVPRMRCSRFADTLPPAFAGSAAGGILLIPITVGCMILFPGRVEGLAGNSGPLSIVALLATGWSLLLLTEEARPLRTAAALLGALGGAFTVIMSGMRGAWPALPVVILIALVAQRRAILARWRRMARGTRTAMLAAMGVGVAVAGVLAAPLVNGRLGEMMSDLSLIAANVDSATSLNLRRAMYEAAVQAIEARPWFGYGELGRWDAVVPFLHSGAFQGFSFSHLHNVFLTTGVDAGLVGIAALLLMIAAPVWTAWRARRLVGGTRRLGAALVLVAAFAIPGLSNIMLFHDILDSVWVFALSLIAASVPPPGEGAR